MVEGEEAEWSEAVTLVHALWLSAALLLHAAGMFSILHWTWRRGVRTGAKIGARFCRDVLIELNIDTSAGIRAMENISQREDKRRLEVEALKEMVRR